MANVYVCTACNHTRLRADISANGGTCPGPGCGGREFVEHPEEDGGL